MCPELLKPRSVSHINNSGRSSPHQICAGFSLRLIHPFIYSLVHAVSIAGTHNVPSLLPGPGMWRWGSPWSQVPLYSFHSPVTVSPPGSEGSSPVLQDPCVPHSAGRVSRAACSFLNSEGGERSYSPSPWRAEQGKQSLVPASYLSALNAHPYHPTWFFKDSLQPPPDSPFPFSLPLGPRAVFFQRLKENGPDSSAETQV